ncbi:MAG: TIGR04086 family membrane protein [Oscillospiraceae bacterium]|nr:TIGR04086 family membrane protein [Oscillospiraceae bacterium]
MTKAYNKETVSDGKSLIKHSITGAVIGLFATMLALLIIAALMVSGVLPESLRDSFVLVSVMLGATIGGVFCAGRQGRGVITAGLSSAVAYVLLILLGTLAFKRNSDEISLILRIIIAVIVGGVFGGVLKLHRKNKKSHLRRRI